MGGGIFDMIGSKSRCDKTKEVVFILNCNFGETISQN